MPRDDSAGGALGTRSSVGPGLPDLSLLTGGGKRWGPRKGSMQGPDHRGQGGELGWVPHGTHDTSTQAHVLPGLGHGYTKQGASIKHKQRDGLAPLKR